MFAIDFLSVTSVTVAIRINQPMQIGPQQVTVKQKFPSIWNKAYKTRVVFSFLPSVQLQKRFLKFLSRL